MANVVSKLNYNLQAYTEREALVRLLADSGELDYATSAELDKVANYLLYAEDVDAEVKLKNSSKKKVSYEELIESTLGETVMAQQNISIYRIPKPRIDREKDADIPHMRDLWEAIDLISEKYTYCREVLEGKRDMDLGRELVPTYAAKYKYREWMINLRNEQFLLKDSYRPTICTVPIFNGYSKVRDGYGMCIGKEILCPGELMVDFGNWQHIYAMLKHYAGMKGKLIDDPYHAWWDMYEFLDELMGRIDWTPEYEHILVRKIDKVPNEVIAQELAAQGKTFSVNYISTIFKQNISKEIAREAGRWLREKREAHDPKKWWLCDECGAIKLKDEHYFAQNAKGEWATVCKSCAKKKREEKEKARIEKKRRVSQ